MIFVYKTKKITTLMKINRKIKKISPAYSIGSRKHLGKAITLIESSREKDQIISEKLLELFKGNDKSIRIGITGVWCW